MEVNIDHCKFLILILTVIDTCAWPAFNSLLVRLFSNGLKYKYNIPPWKKTDVIEFEQFWSAYGLKDRICIRPLTKTDQGLCKCEF